MAPYLIASNREIRADAFATSPQTLYPMNSAQSWWPAPSSFHVGSDGTAFGISKLIANDACGTVTWASGGFDAIPTTGSGYVPDTYLVSFTASDSNGLSSNKLVNLIIKLKTVMANTTLHGSAFSAPAHASAPFGDQSCGPAFPGMLSMAKPGCFASFSSGYEFQINKSYFKPELFVDSSGHAWYPIPSASWYDPAAHTWNNRPVSNKVAGVDKSHENQPVSLIDKYGTSAISGWNLVDGNTVDPLPGYVLVSVAGEYNLDTVGTITFTSGAIERTGTIGWEVDIRGVSYSMTASYEVVDGNDTAPSGDNP